MTDDPNTPAPTRRRSPRASGFTADEGALHEAIRDARDQDGAKFHAILASMSDGLITADADGNLIDINAAALQLHGYRTPDQMRKNLREFPEMFELSTLNGDPIPLEHWPLSRALRGERFRDLEVTLHRKDTGRSIVAAYAGSPLRDASGRAFLTLLTIRDITERTLAAAELEVMRGALEQRVSELRRAKAELEEANAQLHHDAFHDTLTELPNRALFASRLERAVADHRRRPGDGFAVMFLDFDGFKAINDRHGHAVGDAFLIAIGRRLAACVRPGDTVGRLGGDEFTLLLGAPLGADEARGIAERLRRELARPFDLGSTELQTTASIGVVYCDAANPPPVDVMKAADLAMYRAKAAGGDRWTRWDDATGGEEHAG